MLVRRVVGRSMLPGLTEGTVVVGAKREPHIGDIVVARIKGREVIKRVKTIEGSGVFLVGDNAGQSTDSRDYGLIKKSDILAVIMVTFPIASNAPKPRVSAGLWLGLIAAALMILFVLLHLYRIDTFIPELNYSLPGRYDLAANIGLAIILIEIFALPSLLRMKLSPLARLSSSLCVLLAPLIWLIIAIINVGEGVSTAQLGAFYSLPSSYTLVIANVIWLGFNAYTLWALGLIRPKRLSKPV